jgi:MFS family permease
MVGILIGTLPVPLDSAVNVDFPRVTQHFDLSIPLIQWLVISYTLTSASLLLVFGRAGDMVGYRRVFLVGTGLSSGAFVLCALAPAYTWLLAFRILQGIGAGLVMSCGPAWMTALYPESRRARALGVYTLAFGIGGALGPLIAAPLIASFGWSAAFWFRAPISALGLILAARLPAPPLSVRAGERFDLPGAGLLVLSTSALLLALNQIRHPMLAAVSGGVAAIGAAGFVRRERQCNEPIIDLARFRDPDFAIANLANVLLNLAGFAVLLLVPFEFARLPRLSETTAGALLAASPAGIMIAAPLTGRLAHRSSGPRLMLVGAVMASAGLLLVGLSVDAPVAIAAAMLFQGGGQGVFQVAYLDAVTAALPRRNRGVAGSLGMLTRSLGLVTGATVLMLAFETFRGLAYGDFVAGFRGTFEFAAAVALIPVAASAVRSLARARST